MTAVSSLIRHTRLPYAGAACWPPWLRRYFQRSDRLAERRERGHSRVWGGRGSRDPGVDVALVAVADEQGIVAVVRGTGDRADPDAGGAAVAMQGETSRASLAIPGDQTVSSWYTASLLDRPGATRPRGQAVLPGQNCIPSAGYGHRTSGQIDVKAQISGETWDSGPGRSPRLRAREGRGGITARRQGPARTWRRG
jgi:hypothetical protein